MSITIYPEGLEADGVNLANGNAATLFRMLGIDPCQEVDGFLEGEKAAEVFRAPGGGSAARAHPRDHHFQSGGAGGCAGGEVSGFRRDTRY